MSIPVLIIGKSGTGKSASMRNFKKEEIDVINVESKPLPFRNDFDTLDSDNYRDIAKAIKNSKKNVVVVDDAGYLLTNSFMRGHASQGAGNAMFNFYNQLADDFWKLITFCKSLDKNKIVYIIMHESKTTLATSNRSLSANYWTRKLPLRECLLSSCGLYTMTANTFSVLTLTDSMWRNHLLVCLKKMKLTMI